MKIELKKVSHSKSLSEETPAYTAQVWIDGKHFCDVTNRGHGGPDEQYQPKRTDSAVAFYVALKELDRKIAAEYPKIDCTTFGGTGTLDRSLEMVCHEMLGEIEIANDLRRLLKRTIAFADPSDGSIRTYKGRLVGLERAHVVTDALRRQPKAVILNNLPFETALAVYEAATAA